MLLSFNAYAVVSTSEMGQLEAMSYVASRCKAEVIESNTNKKKNCVKMYSMTKKFLKEKTSYLKSANNNQKPDIVYWVDNIVETQAFIDAYLSK